MKSKVLQRIVKEYQLIDGQIISGNFLKQIAEEQNMLINELITILGISERNKYKILEKDTITMRINIKDKTERDEIKDKIQRLFLNKDRITRSEIEKLEKQIKMSGRLIGSYIGLDCRKYYELRNRRKYVRLKPVYKTNQNINNSLNIDSIKMKDRITKGEVENIKNDYHKTDEEMINILKTKRENYRNLMKGKTTYLKIDLLSEEEKDNIIKELREYKNEGKITLDDINHLKDNTVNVTDKIIKKAYGIESSIYKKLLDYKIKTSRIVDIKERKKVQLLKIEMKYGPRYGERYYTKKELRQITRRNGVKLEAMLLYMNNPNYYLFNKLALEKNAQGIWIGDNKVISNEFWEEKTDTLEKLSGQAASSIYHIYGVKYDRSELKQIAYEHITNTGFLIEKNFGFDERLQNNLFRKRGKYAIINFLRSQNKLYPYQQYEEQFGSIEERSRIFADNTDNPEQLIEQQTDVNLSKIPIYSYHQRIIELMREFEEILLVNRKYGLKVIAKRMNVSLIKLDKWIKEIREIIKDNRLVKETNKGFVSSMYE